jgi:hypothetical protein
LTITAILDWADAHKARTGAWPRLTDSKTELAHGYTWRIIDSALRHGQHGLAGGDSLARLLRRTRGVRSHQSRRAQLTEEKILRWARVHRERTGVWPRQSDGAVDGVPGETWSALDRALNGGYRDLAGGTSLRILLARRVGARTVHCEDRLDEAMILAWADAHHAATGKWPKWGSPEPIAETGRKWSSIDDALRRGHRGLPGGDSLTELLARNGRPVTVQKRH